MQAAFSAGRSGGPLKSTPSTKPARTKSATTASTPKTEINTTTIPPPALYLSLHLTLSFLLIFSFTFLPRTDLLFSSDAADHVSTRPKTSLDRPEHPFMTAITSDPSRTMMYEVVGIWICMIWWGGWMRSWWRQEKIVKGEMKAGPSTGDALEAIEARKVESRKKLIDFRNALLTTLLLSLPTSTLLILLGAPLSTHLLDTYLLGLHLSILMVHPVVYSLGLPNLYEKGMFDRYRLRRLFSELDLRTPLERATVYPLAFSLLGAWLGIIPLALDWDRPWQAYPLTPAFGSLVGWTIGGLAVWVRGVVEEVEREFREGQDGTNGILAGVGAKVKKGRKSKALKAE